MAFTLFDLLLHSYERLGVLRTSVATGGSVTTVVDSVQTGTRSNRFTNDVRDGGLFLVRDSAGASAAPEGEFSVISAFDPSTGTTTMGTLSAAVAAGDTYSWTNKMYPLRTMIEVANTALQDLGDIRFKDTTTLNTDTGDTEYSIATAWKRRVVRVWQQTHSDSADNQWKEITGWEQFVGEPGSAGTLVFAAYPEASSMDIMVEYMAPHPTVTTYSSVISEYHDPESVVRNVVRLAYVWRNRKLQGSDPMMIQFENKAEQEFRERKMNYPPQRPGTRDKLFKVGDVSDW